MSANEVIDRYVRQIIDERARWVGQRIGDLVFIGHDIEDIELLTFPLDPDCRTVIAVKGEPKYEWKLDHGLASRKPS
jgi:hypothetical protein